MFRFICRHPLSAGYSSVLVQSIRVATRSCIIRKQRLSEGTGGVCSRVPTHMPPSPHRTPLCSTTWGLSWSPHAALCCPRLVRRAGHLSWQAQLRLTPPLHSRSCQHAAIFHRVVCASHDHVCKSHECDYYNTYTHTPYHTYTDTHTSTHITN